MNHLNRELAPIGDQAWKQIEDEATRSLRHFLAGRRLVDFAGPLGWEASAISGGRLGSPETVPGSTQVDLRPREVHRMVEIRRVFTLARTELDTAERGATDIDLDPVVDAAREAAHAEDWCVFHGELTAGLQGITPASPHQSLSLGDDFSAYPHVVAGAIATLQEAGVDGPYGLALGPAGYRGVLETTERGGYPLLEHLRLILDGPVVWAPSVDGAVVISQRGGDYELLVGQDFSIGYLTHDAHTVELYLESSFAFRVEGPEAAVALTHSPTQTIT